MKRKDAKKQAALMARKALELSVETAGHDLPLAKEQASLARRLMLKYNVRFDWPLNRFFCSGCKQLIVPGANARVRVSRGSVLMTCSSCGQVNRKVLDKGAAGVSKTCLKLTSNWRRNRAGLNIED